MTSTCWLPLTTCIMAHIIFFNNEVSNAMPITTRPAQTSTDIPYVEKEEENEPCFNVTNEDGVGCREGYWYNAAGRGIGRYCKKCQNLQNGTGTYQPHPNQCPTCIICPKCEEGYEEITPCSKTKPPECREIRNHITESTVGSPYDTYENPSTKKGEEIRTTLPVTKSIPKADIPPKEESADKESHTDHGWEKFGHISVWIIPILLVFIMILGICLLISCFCWNLEEPFPVSCCCSPSKEKSSSNGHVVPSDCHQADQSRPNNSNAADASPEDEGHEQILLHNLSSQNGDNAEEHPLLNAGPTEDDNDAADASPEDEEREPLNGPNEDEETAL
ncbi:uncharacterized protein [Apostichopus japonicus]